MFLEVKFSIYLNRRVFVMTLPVCRQPSKCMSMYTCRGPSLLAHLNIVFIVRSILIFQHITKTRLFKYTEKLITEKLKIFSQKKSNIFHISAQNIDCEYSLEPPRRGGSNVYPQSMFLSRNKKNNVYPCKPQFYYIKVV